MDYAHQLFSYTYVLGRCVCGFETHIRSARSSYPSVRRSWTVLYYNTTGWDRFSTSLKLNRIPRLSNKHLGRKIDCFLYLIVSDSCAWVCVGSLQKSLLTLAYSKITPNVILTIFKQLVDSSQGILVCMRSCQILNIDQKPREANIRHWQCHVRVLAELCRYFIPMDKIDCRLANFQIFSNAIWFIQEISIFKLPKNISQSHFTICHAKKSMWLLL